MTALYQAIPGDARHGALVVLADTDGLTHGLEALADGLAQDGYETLVLAADDDARAALQALRRPWLLLGVGRGGAAAWEAAGEIEGLAAAAVVCPEGLALPDQPRACPTVVHFAAVQTDAADALREAQPDLPVHGYDAAPDFFTGDSDAARLAMLRTLALFRRSVSRGES